MADRRFETSFKQLPGSDEPGLVLGDDNVVYLIRPDGSRVEVGGGGALGALLLESSVVSEKLTDLGAVTDVQDADEFVLARAGGNNKIDGASLKAAIAPADILVATATITNDQILSIVSTPAQLIAPTEHPNFVGQPSSWLLPIAVVLDCDFTAAEYTNVDAGMLLYVVVSADWELTMLTYFHHGAQASASFAFGNVKPHYVPFLGPPYWDGDNPNGGIADNGLYLAVSNSGLGDFTGGDPANQIKARIFYIAT